MIRYTRRGGIAALLGMLAGGLACGSSTGPGGITLPTGQILFTSDRDGNNELYLVNLDGTGLINLTNNPAADEQANWSFDGSRIVFGSDRTGDMDVYVMDADGNNLVNLSQDTADYNGHGAFSPNGSQIVYIEDNGAATSDVFIMSAVDGTGIVQVVDGPGYTDTDPEWSPDGTRIVFETNRNILGGGNQYDIYVVDVNGANPVNLTPGISASDSDPIWSPDGSKIAFTSSRDGDPEVFVINADGSGLTQLTRNGSATDVPGSFSPDGQFLAFVSDRENPGNFDIWVMAATGGRATRVVKHAAQDRSVVWRP